MFWDTAVLIQTTKRRRDKFFCVFRYVAKRISKFEISFMEAKHSSKIFRNRMYPFSSSYAKKKTQKATLLFLPENLES